MNCHRVQSLLSAYLDQELNGDERRELRTHLFQCPVCDREYRALADLKQLMGSLSAPVPPESLLTAFHQHINGAGAATLSGPWWAYNIRHLSLTAACFSLFLLTSLLIFPQNASKLEIASEKGISPIPVSHGENVSLPQMRITSIEETHPSPSSKYQTIQDSKEILRHGLDAVLEGVPVSRW